MADSDNAKLSYAVHDTFLGGMVGRLVSRHETLLEAMAEEHGLGRRVGGGTWSISRVALAMFLDGDVKALRAYHTGDRIAALVASYFGRAGLV